MDIRLFDYSLPEELIAQRPLEKRDHSRLLILDRKSGSYKAMTISIILENTFRRKIYS